MGFLEQFQGFFDICVGHSLLSCLSEPAVIAAETFIAAVLIGFQAEAFTFRAENDVPQRILDELEGKRQSVHPGHQFMGSAGGIVEFAKQNLPGVRHHIERFAMVFRDNLSHDTPLFLVE
jgi:hypothetical protein